MELEPLYVQAQFNNRRIEKSINESIWLIIFKNDSEKLSE